jgi:fructose 1,6-bisphosphate aldolase/phosphatase
MPLMPVRLKTEISYFDGPPVVSCAAFAVHNGKLTEPLDCFGQPFWDTVRAHVSDKAIDMRRQGFFGAAMLPMSELEYTGIVEELAGLENRFSIRESKLAPLHMACQVGVLVHGGLILAALEGASLHATPAQIPP